MIQLTNKTKTIQVFNLPCANGRACQGNEKDCLCQMVTTQVGDELPDGKRVTKTLERRLPGSVTFLAGEKKGLPDWVGQVPDVKRALSTGALRLVQQETKSQSLPEEEGESSPKPTPAPSVEQAKMSFGRRKG